VADRLQYTTYGFSCSEQLLKPFFAVLRAWHQIKTLIVACDGWCNSFVQIIVIKLMILERLAQFQSSLAKSHSPFEYFTVW